MRYARRISGRGRRCNYILIKKHICSFQKVQKKTLDKSRHNFRIKSLIELKAEGNYVLVIKAMV